MNSTYKCTFVIVVIFSLGVLLPGNTYVIGPSTPFIITLGENETHNDSKYPCEHGKWIEWPLVCDGRADCVDASDETMKLCSNKTCDDEFHFKCDYGGCININSVCDGDFDCVDHSDETPELCLDKSCRASEFKCDYGGCIYKDYKCDGDLDCWDESDESSRLCRDNSCNVETQFRCNYGGCVEIAHKCDGIFHCVDESDEESAQCSNPSPWNIFNLYDSFKQYKEGMIQAIPVGIRM